MINLIDKQGKMICPQCEEPRDILNYTRLKQIEKYEKQTAPLYKCPSCRHVFAPLPEVLV